MKGTSIFMPKPSLKFETLLNLGRRALVGTYKVAISAQSGIMLLGSELNERHSGYLVR